MVVKKTPEEAWSGRKPRISQLKVFGSTAFVWILEAKHTKLDAKSQKLMLTGYSDTHKAYQLVDIKTDCLIFKHDVLFDEERRPFQLSPPVLDPKDQPFKASDLGVRLQIHPLHGRAPVVPILAPTPVPSPARSPRHAAAPPNFPQDSSDLLFDEFTPIAPPASNVGTYTLRPKWWAKTIVDLHDDELTEGRTT